MDILFSILVALHLLGMAAIVGSFFVQMRRKSDFVLTPTLVGAITQVVTGLAIVGLAEASDGDPLNYAKIGVKLSITLVVTVLAFIGRKKQPPQIALWGTIGALALINVVIAVFW